MDMRENGFIDGLEKFEGFLKQLRKDQVAETTLDYARHFNSMKPLADLVYVNNYLKGGIVFGRGFKNFLGLQVVPKKFRELYHLVHPDDLSEVLMATSAAIECAKDIRPEEIEDFIFVLDYRIKIKGGNYARIIRQTSILEASEEDGLITTISLCTDISAMKLIGPVTYRVNGKRAGLFQKALEGKRKDRASIFNKEEISKREKEVLFLISQGMTSNEVSRRLNISIHTVKTHRRNMLKKYDAKSTVELLARVFI